MPASKRIGPQDEPAIEENPAPALLAAGAALATIEESARSCRACPLYASATQTVFGAGPVRADMMMVGEQPGDIEDREGTPFVGPAGRLLWKAIDAAKVSHDRIYLTNVVKHFKWKASSSRANPGEVAQTGGGGWRRLHAKPNRREIKACLPWLEAEVERVKPEIIVGLGTTACQAMLGPDVRITHQRGETKEWGRTPVMITFHPSAILRAPDEGARRRQFDQLVSDIAKAAATTR